LRATITAHQRATKWLQVPAICSTAQNGSGGTGRLRSTSCIEDSFGGDSVPAQKLQFFTSYCELVDLRKHLRSEFADELGLR